MKKTTERVFLNTGYDAIEFILEYIWGLQVRPGSIKAYLASLSGLVRVRNVKSSK